MAWREPTVKLAIASKAPTEQRLSTDKMRRVKRPHREFGFVRIREAAIVVVVVATGVLSQIWREVTAEVLELRFRRFEQPVLTMLRRRRPRLGQSPSFGLSR